MDTKDKNRVQSPYVVVLGGNSVRRKATPPPDAPAYNPNASSPGLDHSVDKPEAPHVYGVIPPLKTMAHDLQEAKPLPESASVKKRWWSMRKKESPKENIHTTTPSESHVQSSQPAVVEAPVAVTTHTAPVHRVIDVPSDVDRARPSGYRSKFMRGIAKKGYLTSKLAVQLPFQAKVGMAVALLVLVVGVPVASRYMSKPIPKTSGAIVAIGTEALVAQVGKSIELPNTETPLVVVATADDIRRLAVPESKPGNKVLLYQKTGKIVVYDAEKDKVLGVVNRSQP